MQINEANAATSDLKELYAEYMAEGYTPAQFFNDKTCVCGACGERFTDREEDGMVSEDTMDWYCQACIDEDGEDIPYDLSREARYAPDEDDAIRAAWDAA